MNGASDRQHEWLEADASGGFASGTASGERTRRYHALLLTATTPPTGRIMLVNGLQAWADTPRGQSPLSTHRYCPDVVFPELPTGSTIFASSPWPHWRFDLPGGLCIEHDILVGPDTAETLLRWSRAGGDGRCRLTVRLLLSGREYHALHHENAGFNFAGQIDDAGVVWQPYPGVPAITALSNGAYEQAPDWYRRFIYTQERDRGLDCVEDLASPGLFAFDLDANTPAVIILRAEASRGTDAVGHHPGVLSDPARSDRALARAEDLARAERARRATARSGISLSAQSYLVTGTRGETIIAGFPWFTDWGRDTFIAMRGLLLALDKLDAAEALLCGWAATVSEGMLPNRFPDQGQAPDYNSVDASLWFIIAVHELLERRTSSARCEALLRGACEAILHFYAGGTRYAIGADPDGLLRAGVAGVQLTWMDAKTGDHVVTPRIGKPVEIQVLWINALRIVGQRWSPSWLAVADRAQAAFERRFINPAGGLFDVVDADHAPGKTDSSLRPNQIFACGGVPFSVLTGSTARAVVDLVEAKLLTPLGLRTLSPDDPAYIGRYRGGPAERDGAYHQGTAWPWLMGPFVDAWLNVRGRTARAKADARARFLPPLMAHLSEAGIGHVCEVVDGDAPHAHGGCPFQAWSLGELIRIRRMLDLEP